MPDDQSQTERDQIPTTMRLLLVLEEVAKAGAPMSPPALAEVLGLPKATVHRLLVAAEAEGFLQRDVDGRSYGPGARMRNLAANTFSSQRMRTERMIIMKALADKVGETCNLAAPDRFGMVYLDRVETHWPFRIQLPVGTQVPFYCTASGKMYLSSLRSNKLDRLLQALPMEKRTDRTFTDAAALKEELSAIRARGYSVDNEEFMDGMVAIAVPILDSRSRLLTTLSIHSPAQRFGVKDLIGARPLLEAAAHEIELLCRD